MKKKTVIKLLKEEKVTQQEITEFIFDYIKEEKNIEPTSQQLTGIINALNMGIFNLSDAIKKSADKLGLQVNRITDAKNNKIRIDVWENN